MDVEFTTITDGYELSQWSKIGDNVEVQFRREDGVVAGLFWNHGCQFGGSPISFDIPENAYIPADGKWQVASLEPLTLSPSLLCPCGVHGFIRAGRWEPC